MKIRNSKSFTLDSVQLALSKGATLHPELHTLFTQELIELEHKGRICLLPTTILELYHENMERRFALFEESCRMRQNVLSSY